MAHEQKTTITGSGPALSAKMAIPPDPKAAGVVCHPHPLYGGNMGNNVVLAVYKGLLKASCAAIRFDFRGVGMSEGLSGNGEAEDVVSALTFAVERLPDKPLILAGYSFGAAVALAALKHTSCPRPVAALIISPPTVDGLDFYHLDAELPTLILVGDSDPFADANALWYDAADLANVTMEVKRGVDHFWIGEERWLAERAATYISTKV